MMLRQQKKKKGCGLVFVIVVVDEEESQRHTKDICPPRLISEYETNPGKKKGKKKKVKNEWGRQNEVKTGNFKNEC